MTRQAELFEKEKLEGPDNTYIKPPLIQAWAERERGETLVVSKRALHPTFLGGGVNLISLELSSSQRHKF